MNPVNTNVIIMLPGGDLVTFRLRQALNTRHSDAAHHILILHAQVRSCDRHQNAAL